MNNLKLIGKSLWHYRRRNLAVALGMAISMAVITGALVTGDSVRSGLSSLVKIRLGSSDLAVTSGDRYFTDSLAIRMSGKLGIPAASVLQVKGSAAVPGGSARIPKAEVYGVEPSFAEVMGPGTFTIPVNENEAVISDNLASRLDIKEGDEILLRISKPGPVPIDAPFVSNEDNIVSVTLTIKSVAGKDQFGRFHLQNTQSAPFNIFISKGYLQKITQMQGLSNLMLMNGRGNVTAAQVEKVLQDNRTLGDAGLHLEKHPLTGEWILRTPRIFFDPPALTAIGSIPSNKDLYFSYFVNEFSCGARSTPYSFVSTLPANQVKPGEIIINKWLADDLGAKTGDSVTMSYFMVGPLRNLTVEKSRFRVSGIIPMDDPRSDRLLMPEIPGLSDAGNCRDWETSIPIDLDKIRDQDEQYWKLYRGTPKAFISPETAGALWQNRFGKFTQVRFAPSGNPATITTSLLNGLHPSETGILVRETLNNGMTAATGGVDFSGLFLGLSFFLIAGGIILTVLLIRLGLDSRQGQTTMLRALGWPGKRIMQMLMVENSLVALSGTIIGLFTTWVYTMLIFKALNGVWNDIILTDSLRPVFKSVTLAAGAAISLAVSLVATWLVLAGFFRRRTKVLTRISEGSRSNPRIQFTTVFAIICGLGALALAGYGWMRIQTVSPVFFFAAGTLMLVSLLLAARRIFQNRYTQDAAHFNLASFGRSNLARNGRRSWSVVLLFAIGIFLVIAVGANRIGPDREGTGGFLYFMESTVPVPDNLNREDVRAKYGLEVPSGFVQMKLLAGDDASCLNLNRVNNPPLLGVSKGSLDGRFRFASVGDEKYSTIPWEILDHELPGGAIPAVADQTVIQWGLGLKIGDTLRYKAESGDTVKIVLAGGLSNSIFQGNLLISESQFLKHWPSVSGTNIFLIAAESNNAEPLQNEIKSIFRDYGVDLKLTDEKLSEFNSVENTYLSIFLVMGALAMLLGTIGLAIILLRNLQERRAEIALLRATGFSKVRILKLIVSEYATLLIYGTLAGGLSSIITIIPILSRPASQVSPAFLLSILLILLIHGFIWILLLGWQAIRRPEIIQSLRDE